MLHEKCHSTTIFIEAGTLRPSLPNKNGPKSTNSPTYMAPQLPHSLKNVPKLSTVQVKKVTRNYLAPNENGPEITMLQTKSAPELSSAMQNGPTMTMS